MESTVRERLMRFIRYKGISVRAFEQSIGASNSYVRNSGNSITADFQRQIFSQYPELNRVWLLTGEGDMLNPSPAPAHVYNASVKAGNMSGGNTVIAGSTIGAGAAADVSHYVAIIEAMSRQLAEAQRQMGVLLDHLTRESAR